MSFQGGFNRITSLQLKIPTYSFSLKCTNWTRDETIDVMINGPNAPNPFVFRSLKFKPNEIRVFNHDSVKWYFCQDDIVAILGRDDKIIQHWQLHIPVYRIGECPECHGTHKCGHCQGQGFFFDHYYNLHSCQYCGGTGKCQTCYVPIRPLSRVPNHAYNSDCNSINPNSHSPSQVNARMLQIQRLQQRIQELQSYIEKCEWDLRMMQLDGRDVSSHSVYSSILSLKHTYNRQLIDLQGRLEQLQGLG